MPSSAGIRAGAAYVELYTKDNRLVRGLDNAQKRLKAFGGSLVSIGARVAAAGAAIAGPLSATILAASNMEEQMNKFNVVFGESSGVVKEWADEFGANVGRSERQIAEFLAGSQDLLVPIGFDSAAATDMSKQLTTLAVDLASFNNKADGDVLRDLHAALTGSGEVMKKYGVIVSEAAVKQELLNQGINATDATEQQKAMARMAIIMRGTTAAQGDAIRSSGSFANQMKALRANVENAAGSIGSALLPVITPLVTKAGSFVRIIGEWAAQNKGLIVQVFKIGAIVLGVGAALASAGVAVLGVSAVFGALSAVITGVGVAIGIMGTVLATLLSPIALVTAGVIALAGYIAQSTGIAGNAIAWLADRFDVLKTDALKSFSGIRDALKGGDFRLAARILWLSLKIQFNKGMEEIKKLWSRGWEDMVGLLAVASNALDKAWIETTSFFSKSWTRFSNLFIKSWETIKNVASKAFSHIRGLFDETFDVKTANLEADKALVAAVDRLDDDAVKRLAEREKKRQEQHAQAQDDLNQALIGARAIADDEIAGAENELRTARKELENQLAAANSLATAGVADADSGPGGPGAPPPPGGLADQIANGVAGALASGGSARGTFSASGIQGLQGGGAMERAATASEKTATNTDRLVKETKRSRPVFT